jgi:transcriptional regulator with XRE-family HTH domain
LILSGVPTERRTDDHGSSIAGCPAALGIDQRRLAALSGLSVPTIQRMEASETMVRGNVDSLVKLIAAFDAAGFEMIDEGAVSNSQGRGVRLKMNSGSAKTYLDHQAEHKASGGTRGGA